MPSSGEELRLIGPLEEEAVREAWPKVEAFLCAALESDGWKVGIDDLLRQISEGAMGLYIVQDFEAGEIIAAATCEVQEYPKSNVFCVAFCGGRELYRWANALAGLEAEAFRFGCDTVRIMGRAGWGRVYPDYTETHRVYERKVVA